MGDMCRLFLRGDGNTVARRVPSVVLDLPMCSAGDRCVSIADAWRFPAATGGGLRARFGVQWGPGTRIKSLRARNVRAITAGTSFGCVVSFMVRSPGVCCAQVSRYSITGRPCCRPNMGDMLFLVVRREGDGVFQRVPWLLWALSVRSAEQLRVPIVGVVRTGCDCCAFFRPNLGNMLYLFAPRDGNALVWRLVWRLLVLSTVCAVEQTVSSRNAGWSSVADDPWSLGGLTCFACLSPKMDNMLTLFSLPDRIKMVLGGPWLLLVLSVGFAGGHRVPIRDAG